MATRRRTTFLYDPDEVRAYFGSLPHLSKDQVPHREGEPTEWFPGLRKSPRQLYRLLGEYQWGPASG